MDEIVESAPPETAPQPESPAGFDCRDLARWTGLGAPARLMPGFCTAQEVESLYRIREHGLYRELHCDWKGFCANYLHVTQRTADRAIGYLEEFGPPFFRVSQCIDISPRNYRKIARYISRNGLLADGKIIALRPENRARLSQAAAGLLRKVRANRGSNSASVAEAIQRCAATADLLRRLPHTLDRVDKLDMAAAVSEIRKAAAERGVLVAGW